MTASVTPEADIVERLDALHQSLHAPIIDREERAAAQRVIAAAAAAFRATPPASRGVREAANVMLVALKKARATFTVEHHRTSMSISHGSDALPELIADLDHEIAAAEAALASTVTPGGSSSGEGAAPFDKAAGAMFGLPWHLASWGDGSEPAVVNICSESHKAVIAENVEREEADFITRACNAYSLKPKGPEAAGEQVRSEAKPSEPVPSPQAQVVEALQGIPEPEIVHAIARALYWRDHQPFPWEEVGELSVIEDYTDMGRVALKAFKALRTVLALVTQEEGDGK